MIGIAWQESNDEGDVDEKYDDETDEGIEGRKKKKRHQVHHHKHPSFIFSPFITKKTGKKSMRFASCLFYSCSADSLINHHWWWSSLLFSIPIYPVNHLSWLKTIRDPFSFWSARLRPTDQKKSRRHLPLSSDVVSDSLTQCNSVTA